MGHFTFWITLSPRLKTETKRLNFDLSPGVEINQSTVSSGTDSGLQSIGMSEFFFTHSESTT